MGNSDIDSLVVKQLSKEKRLDFGITELGEPLLDSPLVQLGKQFVHNGSSLSYYHSLQDMEDYRSRFGDPLPAFEFAGPRRKIFFNPKETTAAIVTCGGLCPGLNNVIRAITFTLNLYGVENVLGIPYGYRGLVQRYNHNLKVLNSYTISKIQNQGGTILGTSRGPQNIREMVDFLVEHEIDILFTIGGDGTQKGAMALCDEITKRDLKISLIGIPKTIDNDLNFLEKTFGFGTAVEAAREAIQRVHTETLSLRNGIGIVKLMGRDSGYIAAQAALASMDVNICLVPEIDFELEGKQGLFACIEHRLTSKGHCLIAVAEGAGQKHLPATGKTDASGNKKYSDIGTFLVDEIQRNFQDHPHEPTTRYVDPSYLIRSLPASAEDGVFCLRLGQSAVHAAMAGKTRMLTGYWRRIFTHVPMDYTVAA
ncbi:ATP-dependent 6-phosphofructokinase, partial [bacterium]|nr:ATP-dependent 6-phosphofructokinase [bacterium]